jgi:hypothetical protein
MPVNATVHEVPIGDNTYYIRRFQPFLALEILGNLQKQFAGPILAQLDGKETPRNEAGEIVLNPEAGQRMMESLSRLSEKLDGTTLRKIAETLVDKEYISVSINGADPRKLDATAQGLAFESVADIFTLCWEVLKFNYSEVIARLSSPTGPARFLVRK